MRKLVLIHGRSQQGKNPEALKNEWVDALHGGLRKNGRDGEIPDAKISFPFFGDTLFPLSKDPLAQAPDVIIKGAEGDTAEEEFVTAFLKDFVEKLGITEDQIRAASDDPRLIRKDIQNWPWVLAVLRVLDRLPGVGARSLALVTRDVSEYLNRGGIQRVIEKGVGEVFQEDEETVVVAHSLGTVVAYNLLARKGEEMGWKVPTLITVGSPLAVKAVVEKLAPVTRPACVRDWYNAYDRHDTVSLFPLTPPRFPVTPIENLEVENRTSNQHGIVGYLENPDVATRILDALLA